MNFLSMKYFLATAQERNFTRAAEKLFITQQTLSAHIAMIEKEVGSKLFVRTSPLGMTYAGEVFYDYARKFEDLRLSMEREFSDIQENQQGILHVGVAHTRGRAIMPEIIAAYKKKYPKITINMEESSNDALYQKMCNRELDVIIASIPDYWLEIESRFFYMENIVLFASNALLEQLYGSEKEAVIRSVQETGSLSALSACPFLMGKPQDIGGKIGMQLIREAGFVPEVSAASANVTTLMDLCVQGAGACFCPDVLVRRILEPSALETLCTIKLGEATRYPIQFGWLRHLHLSQAIEDFISVAEELDFAQ